MIWKLRAVDRYWRFRAVDRRWRLRAGDTLFRASAGSRHRMYRTGEAHWRPGAGSGFTGLMSRSSGRMCCRIHLTNISLRYPSSHCSIDSQTVSGSLFDRPPLVPPRQNILGLLLGGLWPRSPASSLSSYTPWRLPPRKGLASTHYFLPCPTLLFLHDTLLGPVVVGYSVKFVIMSGPRCSVSRVPHIY